MAETWLGPTFCKSLPLNFPKLPSSASSSSSYSSMATFPSQDHNRCRCSSNPNSTHTQPALLVFSGVRTKFTFCKNDSDWALYDLMNDRLMFLRADMKLDLNIFFYVDYDIAGGTAFNGVAEELKNFTTRVAHVLPVSDDGGSTAEIVRVLGDYCDPFSQILN